jgi:tight adherence protein B
MKSGLSVPQALGLVVEQMPSPISEEFGLVLSENKVGVSLEDAFSNLGQRVDIEDVDMFVTSVNILKETGGNLAETFDTIVYVIRERIKAENKIKAMTSQGFYQGMMLLSIPSLLAVYFTLSEPGFMDPMFNNPIGMALLAVVTGLEIVAYVVIMKSIKIDV